MEVLNPNTLKRWRVTRTLNGYDVLQTGGPGAGSIFTGGGGGDDDGWCIYSDGQADPGNHPACPPTLGG